VSADGAIVAGYDTMPLLGTTHAFIWSPTRGIADLNTLLPSLGCNLAGWTLIGVNGISADGTAVTGNGVRNGVMRGFVITGLPLGAGSCRADYDGSGGLAALDIFAFLSSWFVGEPRADFDGNGVVAEHDIHAFLNAWFAGC
jgi:probable HAF family extracellular repeat protein